jgi:uncharacterized protein
MGEQYNLRLVQEFYAAFRRGDIPGVLDTLADDVGWFLPGPKDITPFVRQHQGREQVAQLIAKLTETHHADQFEPREFIAQGGKVVAGKVSNFREYLDTHAWAAAYRGAESSA